MQIKILIFFVIISSLFGYLEWGGGNASFLYESEKMVLVKLFSDPLSVAHPFILLPILGQVILLIAFFQKNPSGRFIVVGTFLIGVLLGFMFVIGLLSLHLKILISTIPFFVFSIWLVRLRPKIKSSN